MAFVIKPIQQEDMSRICSPAIEPQIKYKLEHLDFVKLHYDWARDAERDLFLMRVSGGRNLPNRYFFSWADDVAIFELKAYCLFSFVYVSEPLLPRLAEAEALIAEALKMSGLLLQGNDQSSELNRVPHAEFLPYASLA